MVTVVLLDLSSKEHIRGTMDKRTINNSMIVCRNGRYYTFVRHDADKEQCIYKERLAPYVIREF